MVPKDRMFEFQASVRVKPVFEAGIREQAAVFSDPNALEHLRELLEAAVLGGWFRCFLFSRNVGSANKE